MSGVSANAAAVNAEKSGSSFVIGDSSIGVTMDNGEPKDTDGLQGTEGHTSEGSYTGVFPVTTTIAHAFGSTQSDASNLASSDENKECPSEMVFAVVAVDGNISELIQSSFNNVGLSNRMQLSLIPTSTETSTSTINTDDVRLTSTQNSDGFNQLTLVASTIEQSSQGDESQKFLSQKKDGMKKPTFDVATLETLDPANIAGNKIDENLSKKQRVICPVCDLDFSDLPSMRRHRLIHSEEKPYQCEFCEKAFRRKDNLREHRNIHTLENVYSCTHCGKTFPRKYTHKVHMARFCTREKSTNTRKDDGMITWEDAATKTTHSSTATKALSMKMAASNSKCSDPCHICLKTFRDSSTLKRHLLTHSDERPFKCDQCNKSFRRKDHLQEHIIVHNEVRPFPCPQCGKSFSRKNGLKTHMIRTSHGPFLKGFPSQGEMLFENVTESSMNCSEDADNDELAEAEGNSCEFQEMLTSNQFPDDADVNNQSDVVKVTEDREKEDFVASVVISINLDSSEINSQNGGNSGVNPGNASTMAGLKQTEVTVVLSEKSVETPSGSDLGQFNAKTSEISNSQNKKVSEDEETQKVNDEQCLATFTETELYQEHQKKCEVTSTNTDTQSLDSPSKDDETMPGSQSDDMITEDTLEDGGEMADGELGQDSGGKDPGGDVTNKGQRMCTVCDKQFRDTTALRRHSLVHSGERPHTCDQCDKRFRRRDHLKSHMTTTHHCGTMTFSCKNCEVVFNTRYSLSMHSKSCKKDIACPQTPPVEPTPKPVIMESKSCPICHKTFKDHSTQRRHLKVHSEDRPFPCDLCPKSFRRKDNLKEHMMCHSEQKPFACDDCGKALSRRSSLTNHRSICPMKRMDGTAAVTENTSIPETSFEEPSVTEDSEMCLDNNAQELNSSVEPMEEDMQELRSGGDDGRNHAVGNHSNGEDVGNYGDCDVHGDEDAGVGNHGDGSDDVANQGDGKSFSCNQCGKAFHAKWTLKYHQRVHTGEKPYTCLTCDRQFRQPSHLKIHERTHSGERPYVCEACGRAFIDSSTMRRHARLHKDTSNGDDIIHDSGGSEETGVDPSEAITVEIQVAVPSGDETVKSAQPISTNVVCGVNQSEVPNLVHVPGINQSEAPIVLEDHVGEMALSSKMETLDNINW